MTLSDDKFRPTSLRTLNVAPRPYPDETLLSWFSRLAYANRLSTHVLRATLMEWHSEHRTSARLDLEKVDHLRFLERICWLTPGQLLSMKSPKSYSSNCFACCLACFDIDRQCGREPYDRMHWHGPFAMVCREHGLPLVDRFKLDNWGIQVSMLEERSQRPEVACLSKLQELLECEGTFVCPEYWGAISSIIEALAPLPAEGLLRRTWPLEVFPKLRVRDPVWWMILFDWQSEFEAKCSGYKGILDMRTVSYRRLLIFGTFRLLYRYTQMKDQVVKLLNIEHLPEGGTLAASGEDMIGPESSLSRAISGDDLHQVFEEVLS